MRSYGAQRYSSQAKTVLVQLSRGNGRVTLTKSNVTPPLHVVMLNPTLTSCHSCQTCREVLSVRAMCQSSRFRRATWFTPACDASDKGGLQQYLRLGGRNSNDILVGNKNKIATRVQLIVVVRTKTPSKEGWGTMRTLSLNILTPLGKEIAPRGELIITQCQGEESNRPIKQRSCRFVLDRGHRTSASQAQD